jgi:hypothetical protein
MDNLWLIALSAAMVISFLILIWLMIGYRKLKRNYSLLVEAVNRNSNDISGLCTAAITVDEHIGLTAEQLTELWEKIADLKSTPTPTMPTEAPHAYSGDIQKVRSGASIHELMQSSGLSHDEAALLIRLHGSKSQL